MDLLWATRNGICLDGGEVDVSKMDMSIGVAAYAQRKGFLLDLQPKEGLWRCSAWVGPPI